MATRSTIIGDFYKDILGCPWCGEKPEIAPSWTGISLECRNGKGCRVNPSTGWCENLDEAIAILNRRSGA